MGSRSSGSESQNPDRPCRRTPFHQFHGAPDAAVLEALAASTSSTEGADARQAGREERRAGHRQTASLDTSV
jgi:hypothetical protein